MKGRLANDVDCLVDLDYGREDNIFHIRMLLAKWFQSHRGQRDILPETQSDIRIIVQELSRLESERVAYESRLMERYKQFEIDNNNKNVLFGLLSRVQRNIKNYYNRFLVVFPRLADHLNSDTCEFQNEIRQLVLEKISGGKKIYEFFEEFQKMLSIRLKKEIQRLSSFYSYYSCLIDKRAEKPPVTFLKIDKYLELTTKDSIILSVKYHISQMHRSRTMSSPLTSLDLYGISDLEQQTANPNYCSTSCLPPKQEGFCETYCMKMDRIFKELMARNLYHDKVIGKYVLQSKLKESQALRSAKSKDKKPVSMTKRIRSNKSVVRSMSQNNDSQVQSQASQNATSEETPKQPVVRQTLLEMNINDRNPLPHLTNFRLTEFPSNNFSFYKDKLNKTQLLMLFRRRFPVILKQNV